MNRIFVLAAAAAALSTSACITVIDADVDDHGNWTGQNAQPFDSARNACRDSAGRSERSEAFAACMAGKGWTRSED